MKLIVLSAIIDWFYQTSSIIDCFYQQNFIIDWFYQASSNIDLVLSHILTRQVLILIRFICQVPSLIGIIKKSSKIDLFAILVPLLVRFASEVQLWIDFIRQVPTLICFATQVP